MNPSPQQLEYTRNVLLTLLAANNTRFGLQAPAIVLFARSSHSVVLTADEAAEHMEYFVDKKLAVEVTKQIVRAARAWRITPDGLTYLDEHGL
jgi:hypothetical protein